MTIAAVRRAVLLLAALCLVTVGVAGSGTRIAGAGARDLGPAAIVLAAVVLLAGWSAGLALLRLLVRRPRRRRRAEPPHVRVEAEARWWEKVAAVAAAVALTVAVVAVVVAVVAHSGSTGTPGSSQLAQRSATHGAPGTHGASAVPVPGAGSGVGAWSAALAAAGGLAVLLLVIWLGHRLAGSTRRAEVGPRRAADRALVAALAAASTALSEPADPRTAVLASYQAMATSLGRAGTPRQDTDTPADLLRRAAGRGLTLPPAAGRLADLFGEARFSTHPITAAQRDAAADALRTVRASLGDTP